MRGRYGSTDAAIDVGPHGRCAEDEMADRLLQTLARDGGKALASDAAGERLRADSTLEYL